MSCRFGLQNSRRVVPNWKAANVTLFLSVFVFVVHHQKNPMNGLKTTKPDFHAHRALIFPRSLNKSLSEPLHLQSVALTSHSTLTLLHKGICDNCSSNSAVLIKESFLQWTSVPNYILLHLISNLFIWVHLSPLTQWNKSHSLDVSLPLQR